MAEAYTPTKDDLDWCRGVVEMIRDGGYWLYPAAGWIFKVDKTNQTLHLVDGPRPESTEFHTEQWERIKTVFAEFHYKVEIVEDYEKKDL